MSKFEFAVAMWILSFMVLVSIDLLTMSDAKDPVENLPRNIGMAVVAAIALSVAFA